MLVISGSQQQRGGVDGSTRDDDHIGRISFRFAVALHRYARERCPLTKLIRTANEVTIEVAPD